MTRNFAAPAALFTLGICAMALAACSDSAEETSEPQPEAELVAPQDEEVPYAATNPPSLPTAFPTAIQGRWGLVPADCTSTKGDAKGLLEISPDRVKFYESVGVLGAVIEGDDDDIRATFSFTGEGMEWRRDMEFDLEDDGKVLIRKEFGQDAAPGEFRYTRCA